MRLHHLAIRVRDLATVAAFYRAVLGLEELPATRAGAIWLRIGEGILMLEQHASEDGVPAPGEATSSREEPGSPGLHLLAFAIAPEQRELWRARLAEHGIPIVSESAYTLYVRDPEGNRVGLSSYPER